MTPLTDGQKLQRIGWWFGMRVLIIASAIGLVKLVTLAFMRVA